MNAADEGRIPSPILDEAAEWLVRLQDSGCTDDTRQACAQWRQRSPQHAHAWERAERLLQCLGRLPPALALPTLGCSAARNSSACCAINPTRLVFQWWKRNFRIARRVPPGYPN